MIFRQNASCFAVSILDSPSFFLGIAFLTLSAKRELSSSLLKAEGHLVVPSGIEPESGDYKSLALPLSYRTILKADSEG